MWIGMVLMRYWILKMMRFVTTAISKRETGVVQPARWRLAVTDLSIPTASTILAEMRMMNNVIMHI